MKMEIRPTQILYDGPKRPRRTILTIAFVSQGEKSWSATKLVVSDMMPPETLRRSNRRFIERAHKDRPDHKLLVWRSRHER